MPGWGLEGQEEITKRYEKLTGMICIFFNYLENSGEMVVHSSSIILGSL